MEFSDIALAKLMQVAPDLGPLIVNFQDVTEELGESAQCQVGVFVLQSGAEGMFVPVIAKGGDVFPIDSVFVDSQKRFLPLTRMVIDSVIASGQLEPGKPVKVPDSVTRNPNVYNLINPPRTGKFVYASASRMVDFMAELSPYVKKAAFESIRSEKSVYDSLDKMFGLKAIFDVLNPAPSSLAAKTNEEPISVITSPVAGLGQEAISNILNDGYHISGSQPSHRVAVATQDFNRRGQVREVSSVDADRDYDIAFKGGITREAFLPRMHKLQRAGRTLALYTSGDYSLSSTLIAVGQQLDRKVVLDRLFDYKPPVLLRDLGVGESFVVMTREGEFLGPYRADNVVLNSMGVELLVCDLGGSIQKICGYRNFAGSAELLEGTLYLPSNSVVLKLGEDLSCDLECSVIGTARNLEFRDLQMLGSQLDLGFDGVEFSANGKVVGALPNAIRLLVVQEGIEPDLAKSFVKQAQESKFVRIYMSKQASTDYNAAEVPSYGAAPPNVGDVSMNGAFMPNLRQATQLGDSQVVEATVISTLLQTPDMFAQIGEYLPDIEEAVDKLGRILFMTRVHIDKLATNIDSDSVFSLLAQVKGVYRLLGDNLLRLRRIVTGAQYMPQEDR